MIAQLTHDIIEQSTKPIIIKSFASWCPHCSTMKPIFEQLEKELGQKYTFTEFDVDKYPDLTQQFKIASLPTFIFIKNKNEVGRILGEMTQNELEKNIEKYLN